MEIFETDKERERQLHKLRRHVIAGRATAIFLWLWSSTTLIQYFTNSVWASGVTLSDLRYDIIALSVRAILIVGSFWRPFHCLGVLGVWWLVFALRNLGYTILNSIRMPQLDGIYYIITFGFLGLYLAACAYLIVAAAKAKKYEQLKKELPDAGTV